MKQKIIITSSYIFIVFILINLFLNYAILPKIMLEISLAFIKNVFPFLFISMILNNLLIYLNFPYYLYKLTHNKYLYLFILSILSGSPINSIIISQYLDNNYINEKEASLLLCCTCFCNPIFIYNYLTLILNNKILSIKIMIIIYLINFIIFLIINKKLNKQEIKIKKQKFSFTIIPLVIKKSIINMLNIFGTIVFFKIITSILLKNNSTISIFLKGTVEITSGLISLSLIHQRILIKTLLAVYFINFLGLSIHMQISLVLSKYQINYKYFYLSRIIITIFSSLFILIL